MSFVDAVKEFVGFGDVEYDDEDDVIEEEEELEKEDKPSLFSRKSKVVAIDKAPGQPTIVIEKPKCFSAATEAADQLKLRHPVVLDVTGLDAEEAKRTVDFITGAVYGINGDIQKVSSGIFIATPASFDISGEYVEGKSGAGMDWTMFK